MFEEVFFKTLMKLSLFIIVASLLMILGVQLYKGLPSLTWEMISQVPGGGFYFGEEGGILNAIVGSLCLGAAATILSFLAGIPVAILLNVYEKKGSMFSGTLRTCLDILWGIPSIVYGAFGFLLMTFLGLKVSLLAGTIVLTLVILPLTIRSMDELIKTIPVELSEAGFSLGATKWETAFFLLLRQVKSGILTTMLLGFGRAIGDAASVLFTAGYTDHLPRSWFSPVASLPLAIFFQLSSPIEAVRKRAYAAALVLTLIILIISLTSRFILSRSKKY